MRNSTIEELKEGRKFGVWDVKMTENGKSLTVTGLGFQFTFEKNGSYDKEKI